MSAAQGTCAPYFRLASFRICYFDPLIFFNVHIGSWPILVALSFLLRLRPPGHISEPPGLVTLGEYMATLLCLELRLGETCLRGLIRSINPILGIQ